MTDVETLGLLARASEILPTSAEDGGLCPQLSLPQRILGCACCLFTGFLLSFGATGRILDLVKGDPRPFVVYFTMGVLLQLVSSCFFAGPQKQVSQMFDEKRRGVSIVLLCTISATIFVGFHRHFRFQAEILLGLLAIEVGEQPSCVRQHSHSNLALLFVPSRLGECPNLLHAHIYPFWLRYRQRALFKSWGSLCTWFIARQGWGAGLATDDRTHVHNAP